MSSEGDSPGADDEETISALQNDDLEDNLGTQIEDDINYDPYTPLHEVATPLVPTDALEQSKYRPPHVSGRSESSHETIENDRLYIQHTSSLLEHVESPQTSQGPTPTQRSRGSISSFDVKSPTATNALGSDAQEGDLDSMKHTQDATTVNNGCQTPEIKTEEQDDEVLFIMSNTLDEIIIISDDEDTVVDPVQNQSVGQTAIQLASQTEVNMGNSILRTRKVQKATKKQMEMMKQAQQMLGKHLNRKAVTGGAGNIFKGTTGQGYVASAIANTLNQAEAVASTNENAWMDERMDDSDDSVSSVIISKLERKIAGKVKKDQPVLRDEIELISAEKRQAIRARRHRIDELHDDEPSPTDSLFVSDDGNGHKKRKLARDASQQHSNDHDPVEHSQDLGDTARVLGDTFTANEVGGSAGNETGAERNSERRHQSPLDEYERDTPQLMMAITKETDGKSGKKSKKRRAGVAKTAKEAHQRNRDKLKITKTSKTKAKARKDGGKKESQKVTKANPAKEKPVKHATGGYGKSGDGSDLLMNLVHNSAIRDRLAQGTLGQAPVIKEKSSKDRMLKELIASVPKEHKRHITNDKKDLLNASRNFGFGKVVADEGRWRLKGMRNPLYHHQLLGADFMVGRECGTLRPFGGLLADAMGLGKTLQMLATMVGNPPTGEEAKRSKITLLVVPSGVIRQWQDEIARHVDSNVFKKIMHYKARNEISVEILQDCDILITSYAEVMSSYPWPDQDEMKTLTASTVGEWSAKNWERRGVLHQLLYYRVVLDEAHIIRNYKSRTSIACVSLDARLRWALTGTPILNRLEELYPYFRFLAVDYAADIHTFKREFCNPHSADCEQRVVSLLSYMMIRRTLQDKIFDRPIVELPQTHPAVMKIDFSKEERALYQILEDRFRKDFNTYFQADTAQRNYRNIVVKLLRLRQCTAHPFLLRQTIKDIFTLEDLRNLEARLASASTEKRPIYERIGLWVKDSAVEKGGSQATSSDINTPAASSETEGGINFGKSSFGNRFEFVKYLSTLNEKELLARCVCGICGDVADEPTITDCNHVFCRECIQMECNRAAAQSDWTECPVCSSAFGSTIAFEELRAKENTNSVTPEGEESQTKGRRRRKAAKISHDLWLDMPGEMLPSAKTIALKQQILQWQEEAPGDKIVIFTQFRLMAKIIAKICEGESWPFVLYTGDMTTAARHKAVQDFDAQDSGIRIMIAGLKCGGQGLNLTMANRVISVDLWWNHSVELQAFGRVFRIGQHKETYLTRLVVRNTVDDRLLKMQEDKLKVVDNVMMDDGRKVKTLTVEELASLFGFLTKDAAGNQVLEPHEDDEAVPTEDSAQPS